MHPEIVPFFHAATSTWSYLVVDPATRAAAVIDAVLDYEPKAAHTATLFADAILAHIHEKKLELAWVLETHVHADHLSAGAYLREQTGAPLAIGAGIVEAQRRFRTLYGLGAEFAADGSDFDQRFADGARVPLGSLEIQVLATPGHTADALTYVVGDAAFIGDTLFAPDVGSARCDFPGGDATMLWRSIQRLLALPDATRLCLAHDYPPPGREPRAFTTPAEQRARNVHVAGKSEAEFVALRQARDATLAAPQLLLPALQVNIRGGRLPAPDANGVRYLRLPLDQI